MFFNRRAALGVNGFDEELGVGAGTLWGSGEETDYLLQIIDAGYTVFYEPELTVCHPNPLQDYDVSALKIKGYSYGCGMGRVLRKHKYPLWLVLYQFIRALGGIIISFLTGNISKIKYYFSTLKGRVFGWCSKL